MDEIGAVAVLADPVRPPLYDDVCAAPEPVGREEAAQARGRTPPLGPLPPRPARRRGAARGRATRGSPAGPARARGGRPSSTGGRPPRSRCRCPAAATTWWAACSPTAVERTLAGGDVAGRCGTRRRPAGARSARRTTGAATSSTARAACWRRRASSRAATDSEVCLRNCPFDALASEHTALVCGVNLDFVTGRPRRPGLLVRSRAAPAGPGPLLRAGLRALRDPGADPRVHEVSM